MFRKIFTLLLVLACTISVSAQNDTLSTNSSHRLRISFLTCGPGDEIWAQFGHNAIRVTDSIAKTDLVYNYGTFAFGEGFEIQFMRGKLLYYVSAYPYRYFLAEYSDPERRVEEQVLLIDDDKKAQIQAFLVNNAKEENRYYKYDFFFDNCATRLRDILPDVLGSGFQYSSVLPEDSKLTFRNIMDEYFYRVHFERIGCNLLLGSPIDAVMSDKDIMFLPDYVRNGLKGATINGKLVAAEPEVIFEGPGKVPAGPNWPFIIISALSILCIIGLVVPQLKLMGNIMQFLFLFVTGLLGCLMVVMWLGTDHQGCQNNYNILWALPTNLFLAFLPKRNKGKYAVVGIILVFVSLLLHLLRVQQIPLVELSPLLLALLFIFGTIIKRNK